jgi:hypothetical protein
MLPTCCKTSVADSSLYPKFLISRFLTRSIVDSRLAVDHVADERGQLEGVLSVLEQLQLEGAAQAVVPAVVELLAVDGQRADEAQAGEDRRTVPAVSQNVPAVSDPASPRGARRPRAKMPATRSGHDRT